MLACKSQARTALSAVIGIWTAAKAAAILPAVTASQMPSCKFQTAISICQAAYLELCLEMQGHLPQCNWLCPLHHLRAMLGQCRSIFQCAASWAYSGLCRLCHCLFVRCSVTLPGIAMATQRFGARRFLTMVLRLLRLLSSFLQDYQKEVLAQLRPVSWATVVFTSAVTKQRVMQILDAASAASENHRRRISTATLNMVVKETVAWRAPPQVKNSYRKGRIYYATQAAASPPTFVMFVNDAKLFSDDYRRYFERQLRDNIGFPGTPIRIFWRGKQSQKDRD